MMHAAKPFQYNIMSELVVEVRWVRRIWCPTRWPHTAHPPQVDDDQPDTPYDAAMDTVFQIEIEVPC